MTQMESSDDNHSGRSAGRPYVITLGNEKGGTGKSTTALHLAIGLLQHGFAVGTIDLDGRQGTLSRGLANRAAWAKAQGRSLLMPRHRRIELSSPSDPEAAQAEDRTRLDEALADLAGCDFALLDTPGSSAHLSRLGHLEANSLITPLNDSFVDVDVLAEVNMQRREVLAPSIYTKLVWEQNNLRIMAERAPIDWIVMRNRLSHVDARNKREIAGLLALLAKRIGFRLAPGFGERVVFRELFDKGLTVLDLDGGAGEPRGRPSHETARREVQGLLAALGVTGDAAEATA